MPSSISERLLAERVRLGLTQPAVAELCQVTIRTQRNYETGDRAPDAHYLAAFAAAGADVRFVITGARDYVPSAPLSAEEQTLIDRWREASREVKNAAMGALLGASAARSAVHQKFAGPVGHVTEGDSHISGGNFVLQDSRGRYGPASKVRVIKAPKKP